MATKYIEEPAVIPKKKRKFKQITQDNNNNNNNNNHNNRKKKKRKIKHHIPVVWCCKICNRLWNQFPNDSAMMYECEECGGIYCTDCIKTNEKHKKKFICNRCLYKN